MGIMDAKQKLIELTDQIARQEAETREKATGLRHQLESAGTDAATDILSKTRQAIAVEKDKATREMNAQIAATRKTLQAETETLAINVMEKILHRGIG
jgi:F0F1-type ATP synthase membrane subunit b/b'